MSVLIDKEIKTSYELDDYYKFVGLDKTTRQIIKNDMELTREIRYKLSVQRNKKSSKQIISEIIKKFFKS